jgi:hypothetical protein
MRYPRIQLTVAVGQMYSVEETAMIWVIVAAAPFLRGQLVTVGAQLWMVTTLVE